MDTVLQSCQLEKESADLLERQAKRRKLEVATLSSIYLKEKAREEEFPGIGFRDTWCGREAYIVGHRVAVWEVLDVYKEAKSVAATADYYRWPEHLIESALAYAKSFPLEVAAERAAEVTE
jgi:uncharacterized protein (DUF433 family)